VQDSDPPTGVQRDREAILARSAFWQLLLTGSPPGVGWRGLTAGAYVVRINRYKAVYDVFGFVAGNEGLEQYGSRIADWAGPGALITMLSDDAFAVVRPEAADLGDAVAEADRLHAQLGDPIVVGADSLTRSVRIGVSVGSLATTPLQVLLQQANDAMETIDALHGRQVQAFHQELRARALEVSQIELHMLDALRSGELQVHYQPEVDLRSGRLTAMEALLRWRHPSLGLVSADRFIAIAEQSNLIAEMSEHVLRTACQQQAKWASDHGSAPPLIRVNMSPAHLVEPSTPQAVAHVLAETGLDPKQLCVEVTEVARPPALEDLQRTLGELRATGVVIAMDDFGIGYSSLARLKSLPIDEIKIDREFVLDLGVDPVDTVIVRSIIDLAATLEIDVVAEGIERPGTVERLLAAGCRRGQGHLFGEPALAAELDGLLRAGGVSPTTLAPLG
jgi:EAL domain-containing protein (putative c-di-GMP-specific phosphodiesterase class I)/GGDEF domain-containing protein